MPTVKLRALDVWDILYVSSFFMGSNERCDPNVFYEKLSHGNIAKIEEWFWILWELIVLYLMNIE